MMKVVRDDLWLCMDCTLMACNGDTPGCKDEAREAEVIKAVRAMGVHLVADHDSESGDGVEEFSWRPCDCCSSHLDGMRHRFAVLG